MTLHRRRLNLYGITIYLFCCPLIVLNELGMFFFRQHARQRHRKAQEKHEREWKAKRAEDAVVPRDFSKSLSPLVPSKFSRATNGILNLPYEIREMIWKCLLDGQILHVVRKEHGKIGYLQCRDQGLQAWQHPPTCWGKNNGKRIFIAGEFIDDGIFRGRWEQPDNDRTDGDLMALMRSCKTIYSDVNSLIYKLCVFSFHDLDTLRYFSYTTHPAHLSSIRSLFLRWLPFYPAGAPEWMEVCDFLSRMQGLEHLRIDVFGEGAAVRRRGLPTTYERPWDSLQKISHVDDFVVKGFMQVDRRSLERMPFRYCRHEEILEVGDSSLLSPG